MILLLSSLNAQEGEVDHRLLISNLLKKIETRGDGFEASLSQAEIDRIGAALIYLTLNLDDTEKFEEVTMMIFNSIGDASVSGYVTFPDLLASWIEFEAHKLVNPKGSAEYKAMVKTPSKWKVSDLCAFCLERHRSRLSSKNSGNQQR